MKTNFDKLIREIDKFEKKAGFEKTTRKELIKWMKKEIVHYENSTSKKIKENKLMDIIILALQIAKRDDVSLDEVWIDWFDKSRKYL